MSNRFSGLKRVGYSDTIAGAVTWITGKVSADSDITPDIIGTDATDSVLYGGASLTGEIGFFDHADYASLVTLMKANTEKFWHFEYNDGTTVVTAVAFNIMVKKGAGVNARDGLVAFMMSFEAYNADPIF